jgi:hypothetical protein
VRLGIYCRGQHQGSYGQSESQHLQTCRHRYIHPQIMWAAT